ncbi:hypothetical protein MANES_10G109706v8 [Manihot esculenta]|uniref:Uncharacterized protein n=1 Tax=Manihot esculenta TaxID=3983 RepID=A0ACB7H2A1_MANES|nr:hypothetical protein MANES_10G109706v8 [Manihot esculenta]
MEEVMNDADVEIVESNVVIDGSGSVLIISFVCLLQALWNTADVKFIALGNGCFLVNFSREEDYQKDLLDGPWTIIGSYLLVQL